MFHYIILYKLFEDVVVPKLGNPSGCNLQDANGNAVLTVLTHRRRGGN